MAEALVIVGAAAACLQLSDGFLELGKWIAAAIKGVQHVPQHISDLRDNAELFTICLRKLARAAKMAYSPSDKCEQARETTRAMRIIRRQGWRLEKRISKLVMKAEGGFSASAILRVVTKIQVMFKPNGTQCLQDSLSRLMHTTDVLSSGVTLDILLTKIKELEARNESIPEDLREEV
jgi:hypothetical protein